MRQRLQLFFSILLVFFLSCEVKQSNPEIKISEDSVTIDSVVAEMAKQNILTGPSIGIGGMPSEQWARFQVLCNKASNEELTALAEHENVVVRCYAFDAICQRKEIAVLPILLRHLSDTTMFETMSGCLIDADFAGSYFFRKYLSINNNRSESIDSVLLYGSNSRLRMETSFFKRVTPRLQYYDRLRQLYIEGGETEAVVALAKYRKIADRKMIRDLLYSKDSFIQEDALDAVVNFPDPTFFVILEKMVNEELKSPKKLESPRESVYKAVVHYKNIQSRKLLDRVLSSSKDHMLVQYSDMLFHIVRENPDPIYDGLKYRHTYF